jgi:hypothetical protein
VCVLAVLLAGYYVVRHRQRTPVDPVADVPKKKEGNVQQEKYRPALASKASKVVKWINVKDGWIGPKEFGIDTGSADFGDGISLHFEFTEERYAYILSFTADGGRSLLWPEDNGGLDGWDIAPARVRQIDCPAPGKEGKVACFVLKQNPKGGSQAFALVLSAKPLPSFREWGRTCGELPWDGKLNVKRPYRRGDSTVWHPRAEWVRDEEELKGNEAGRELIRWPHLVPLLDTLKKGSPADEIHLWAFPVYQDSDD